MPTPEEYAARVAKAKETRERNKREKEERDKAEEAAEIAKGAKITAKHKDEPKKPQRRPWAPAAPLSIPEEMKDPRFAYKWANRDHVGNLPKKIQEGWELDTELQAKLEEKFGLTVLQTSVEGLPDSSSRSHKIDSSALAGDLVLMRMPIELHQERDQYYFEQTKVRQKPSEKLNKEARDLETGEPVPTGAYGKYTEEFGRDV